MFGLRFPGQSRRSTRGPRRGADPAALAADLGAAGAAGFPESEELLPGRAQVLALAPVTGEDGEAPYPVAGVSRSGLRTG